MNLGGGRSSWFRSWVFFSHRTIRFPNLGAWFEGHVAITPTFRMRVARQRRIITDDALTWGGTVPRIGFLGRPLVSVVLSGRSFLRYDRQEVVVEAGQIAFIPTRERLLARQEDTADAPFEVLFVEWELGILGTRRPTSFGVVTVRPDHLRVLREASSVLAGGDDPIRGAAAVADALEILRLYGAPFDAWIANDLVADVMAGDVVLSRALDRALSALSAKPMVQDVRQIAALSERQLARRITEFNARYGFNAVNWRDALKRWRLLAGTVGMTVPGAKTEHIAAMLGYASPAAFCRSFAEAGLPSPGSIAARMAVLGP